MGKSFTISWKSFLIVLFIGFAQLAIAQMPSNLKNVKVNQLSDQQIVQIWKQFQQSGVSEMEAMNILKQKGMSDTEITNFRLRVSQLQTSNKGTIINKPLGKDSLSNSRDSIAILTPLIKKPTRYFGFDFFNNPLISFEPNLRIATPKNYVLGTDDELTIVLTGLNETTSSSKVSTEGTIQIPYAGLVQVTGLTIEEATARVKTKLQKIYPGLSSGRTLLSVSLSNIRSIKVTVIGEAAQPGTFQVSSLASIYNALYLSGGPNENGSLRQIELIRNNKLVQTIDFYQFLLRGIMNNNVRLEDQDVIRFPVYTKRAFIGGEVKRPSYYELKTDENLSTLLNFAGGFTDTAYQEMMKIYQVTSKGRMIRDIKKEVFNSYTLFNADSVVVDVIMPEIRNAVTISGAVFHPGQFELNEGLSLSQLVRKADGLREEALTGRGYIKRKKTGKERMMLSFDIDQIMSGKQADIPLIREDSVIVLSADDLRNKLQLTIGGEVRMSGDFEYRKGIRLADLIIMAGGFTNQAATHRVEISRLDKNTADTLANNLMSLMTVEIDSALQNANSQLLLEPLDYVHIPRLVNYRNLGYVNIRGEILFPGDYVLSRRDETAPELIKRSGGGTPIAALQNAQLYRNGVRVEMNLLSDQVNKTNIEWLLLPGDSIFIPRQGTFVEVKGFVNTPQLLRFNSTRFKYYISAAGGVNDKGSLRRAYIQYPNGINRPVRKFLFFRNYPSVKEGSRIIVPEKSDSDRNKLSIAEVATITTSLTAILGLIIALKN
jgi:protein involved in polysaccharide export with SLBB domain